MNRKEWRILPILLIIVMIISAFGCSKKNDENENYTYINENGEIEQYTFSGIPGDRPYIPSRDDMVYDRDKTTAEQNPAQNSTETPSNPIVENGTKPSPTPTEESSAGTSIEETSSEAPSTEGTTKGKLTKEDIEKILNGFKGTEEEAIKECEEVLGRELTESEKQAVYVIYKVIGNKPDISEPPLGA